MQEALPTNSVGVNTGFSEGELRKQGLVTVGILFLTAMVMVGGAMWCSADGERERGERSMEMSSTSKFRVSQAEMQTSAGGEK
jgi:hypothetical protein